MISSHVLPCYVSRPHVQGSAAEVFLPTNLEHFTPDISHCWAVVVGVAAAPSAAGEHPLRE